MTLPERAMATSSVPLLATYLSAHATERVLVYGGVKAVAAAVLDLL